MEVIQEIAGLPFEWGGERHSGWLPKGASPPLPTPIVADVLDLSILEESGGYLLVWSGRNTQSAGDSWHEDLDKAEVYGRDYFGIPLGSWLRPVIRRAAERSFSQDEQRGVVDHLCRIMSGNADYLRAIVLVLAQGRIDQVRNLVETALGDSRDLLVKLGWSNNYEKDAVPPEELVRRYEALGLKAPDSLLGRTT